MLTIAQADAATLQQSSRFQVFHNTERDFAAGDKIRITHNGTTADVLGELLQAANGIIVTEFGPLLGVLGVLGQLRLGGSPKSSVL